MENVNTENNATSENNAAEVKTSFFGKMKSTVTSPRFKRTLAAAAGVGGGLALTAASERSNKASLALTAGFGVVEIMSTHKNGFLEEHFEDNLSTLALIAGVKTAETAIVGAVANRILGDKPGVVDAVSTAETTVLEETKAEMTDQPAVGSEEVKRPTIIEVALSVFKPKTVEPPVATTVTSEVKVEKESETQPVVS